MNFKSSFVTAADAVMLGTVSFCFASLHTIVSFLSRVFTRKVHLGVITKICATLKEVPTSPPHESPTQVNLAYLQQRYGRCLGLRLPSDELPITRDNRAMVMKDGHRILHRGVIMLPL